MTASSAPTSTVALVGLLFATALTLISNLCADLIYGWLDPRIAYA